MDDHIDFSKSFKRLIEQTLDVCGLCNIRSHCNGVSAVVLNLGCDSFGFRWVASIVHRDCETIVRQPFRNPDEAS